SSRAPFAVIVPGPGLVHGRIVVDGRVIAHVQHGDGRRADVDEVGGGVFGVLVALVIHDLFFFVSALAQGNVVLVVFDRVGMTELPGAVDKGEQKRRDGKGDDDRGERE